MKKITFPIIQTLISLGLGTMGCTKLDTKVYDQVEHFWETEQQVSAGIAPAYAGLRNYVPLNGGVTDGIYALLELSADGLICPERAGNWRDGGLWERLWKHKWTPFDPSVQNGWTFIFSGITRINQILQTVSNLKPRPANYASIVAELRTLRAFYNFLALDLFGNTPIVDSNNVNLDEIKPRSRVEVFNYVEKELKDNIPALTTEVSTATYGRATRWFGYAVLAKLYLNAPIYTGTARWADCVAACDAILQSNNYRLEADYFANFKIANEGSKENIFVIPFDINAGLGSFWIQQATLHSQSNLTFGLQYSGYNSVCSPEAYYRLFDSADRRRRIFLVGQQYKNQVVDPANIQYTDDSKTIPLSFDPAFSNFHLQAPLAEVAGARCAKWEFNKDANFNMSNDFAVFRLADIILMKAEALYRNQDASGALAVINQRVSGISIRSRVGMPDFTPAELNLDGLLKERALELAWEGWRRNDLIRFGHFTDARSPEKAQSEAFRLLYPIPKAELDKNPYLVQNTGY